MAAKKQIIYALKELFKCNEKKQKKCLIIMDKTKKEITLLFEEAAKKFFETDIIEIKPTGQHGHEPPVEIAEMMLKYDRILEITKYSLTHTDASVNAARRGALILSMPDITKEMFPALEIDYDEMEKAGEALAKLMKHDSIFHVTSKDGLDVTFGIEKQPHISCKLNHKVNKNIINLPSGEIFFIPINMNGVLVFNTYQNIIQEPTRLEIKDNRIAMFESTENGKKLKKILAEDDNAENLAEFGIGLNPNAKIMGNVLMDEKVLGTCHFAFGNNTSFGGTNKSGVHIDVICHRPTIEIDGIVVMDNGVKKW